MTFIDGFLLVLIGNERRYRTEFSFIFEKNLIATYAEEAEFRRLVLHDMLSKNYILFRRFSFEKRFSKKTNLVEREFFFSELQINVM